MGPPLPEPQKKGTLVCVVLKARNLPNKRSIGKQDPYCVLTLNQETLKTKPDKRGGQHPQWDEQLHFDIYEDLEELLAKEELAHVAATTGSIAASSAKPRPKPVKKVMKVTCYADDQREPEFIGEGIIDLTETLKSGEFDEWVPLQAKDRYAGEVYLELTYYLDKAPPKKKKKAPKPAVGSATGAGGGAESYGGAGVFVGDVDEDGADEPPRPPSKHMPRPSEGSLSLGYANQRPGGNGHGNRNDRLSMTGSASHNNLLAAPGSSSNNASQSARRQSDIPAILRPSSSLANFDMYTPPYAQQALQRIPSPAPPPDHRPGSSQGHHQHASSYHNEAASVVANATQHQQQHSQPGHAPRPSFSSTSHQAQPSYNVVPPTPVSPHDPYVDAASEIARSLSALSFHSTVQAPPPTSVGMPAPVPYGTAPPPTAPTPAPAQGHPTFYAYPPPAPSATPTPAMMAHGGHAAAPSLTGYAPAPSVPAPPPQAQPGMYAHTTPPTLHGQYALPPPGSIGAHGTPPPAGPLQQHYHHQQQHHHQQPPRQSSYPLPSNQASASLAPSPAPAHQHQVHSAPTTPAHDPVGAASPASFHALPALPHQQQPQAGPAPMPGGQPQPQPPPPGTSPYGLAPAPPPTLQDFRPSSPAPSMASLASMSSFQTYSHAPPPPQAPSQHGPALGMYAQPPPPPMPPVQHQHQNQHQHSLYSQPPPPGPAQIPAHMHAPPPPNGLPQHSAILPYAYPNGVQQVQPGPVYGQPAAPAPGPPLPPGAGMYSVPPPPPPSGPYAYQQPPPAVPQQHYYGQ